MDIPIYQTLYKDLGDNIVPLYFMNLSFEAFYEEFEEALLIFDILHSVCLSRRLFARDDGCHDQPWH